MRSHLFICVISDIARAAEWFIPSQELSPAAESLVDDYVEWHAQAGKTKGTRLLLFKPINGLGDQMINFVQHMLHYCVTMPGAHKKRLRFVITPGAFDSFTPEIDGTITDNIGVWTAGIDSRINLTYDADLAKQLKHKIVDTWSQPCWPGRCKYQRNDNRIDSIQVLYAVLLRPSAESQALLQQVFPRERPKLLIGLHLRTWVMDPSPKYRSSDELTLKHNSPIFEFDLTKRLYDVVVAETAQCALDVVSKKASSEGITVFVTSDYLKFTHDVASYLQEQRPGLDVSLMPGKPVWSHRAYDTLAVNKDYENVWATWFALSQVDHLCMGNSMFTESAQLLRFRNHPTFTNHRQCLMFSWEVLNDFAKFVSHGHSASLETLQQAVHVSGLRGLKDTTCFPDDLKLKVLRSEL